MVATLQRGFAENKAQNPAAPLVECFLDNSDIPKESLVLDIPDLKISRTYCLSSVANRLRQNLAFTTMCSPISPLWPSLITQSSVEHFQPSGALDIGEVPRKRGQASPSR